MLGSFPKELRFLLYVAGLYITFIYWGYLQEKLSKWAYSSDMKDGVVVRWEYIMVLNALMATGASLTAGILQCLSSVSSPKIPCNKFWKAAITCTLGSPLGYKAMSYISFPMVILVKTCKPVPVMTVGIMLYGTRYKWWKYLTMFLLCLGIALFSYFKTSNEKVSSEQQNLDTTSTLIGIGLVLSNLALDGYTSNEQDYIFEKFNATPLQMMQNVNAWQVLYLSFFLGSEYLLTGANSQIVRAILALQSSTELVVDIVSFVLCASLGQVLIFSVMAEFGSLTWITISVTRKLFTILLSVALFGHTINRNQWMGIASVFVALVVEIYAKYAGSPKAAAKKTKAE